MGAVQPHRRMRCAREHGSLWCRGESGTVHGASPRAPPPGETSREDDTTRVLPFGYEK